LLKRALLVAALVSLAAWPAAAAARYRVTVTRDSAGIQHVVARDYIAADDRGNALYADVGAVPGAPRDLISRCTPAGLPQLVFAQARVVRLDGSRGACALRSSHDAAARGILGASQLPATIRRDYVENSNDSYWLANRDHPFRAFSPIIGLINEPEATDPASPWYANMTRLFSAGRFVALEFSAAALRHDRGAPISIPTS
jgi:hypothetical protein